MKNIKDKFYDYAFNNDEKNIKKIINQYNIIPDLISNKEELLFLCVFLIMENNKKSLIPIIEDSCFDVSYNNFEFITTLCSIDFYYDRLRYYHILKEVITIPNIYENICDSFVEHLINKNSHHKLDEKISDVFKNFKYFKNINSF